jgi:hypothetical protein
MSLLGTEGTIDQLWINSWEDFTQQETTIPDTAAESPTAALAQLAASYETDARESLPDLDLTFCVTPDFATQTRAVVLHALDFLQRDECTRLGLVFPEANALALGVADELRRLGIPKRANSKTTAISLLQEAPFEPCKKRLIFP